MKKKIAVVGAGNAGCITALHQYYHRRDDFEILLVHDPSVPIEEVGQGTALPVANLLYSTLGINFIDEQKNPIKATIKQGILYENWGKRNVFHDFPLDRTACHYIPHLLSDVVLNSNFFKVEEKKTNNLESEIDADYIFDCRGKSQRDPSEKTFKLLNPLNSVFLSRKEGRDPELRYTRCVATPDGWTFVIPNHDSVSYGYLFNSDITTPEAAKDNFSNMFDVVPRKQLNFENYIQSSMFVGTRTILNGNRFSFLEPLEATSTEFYLKVAKVASNYILENNQKQLCDAFIRGEMKRIETFVLWHYMAGSKFDTPFWKYAKSLKFSTDNHFNEILNFTKNNDHIERVKYGQSYAQWPPASFKLWLDVF